MLICRNKVNSSETSICDDKFHDPFIITGNETNISSRFSRNSEAFASELLKDMFS